MQKATMRAASRPDIARILRCRVVSLRPFTSAFKHGQLRKQNLPTLHGVNQRSTRCLLEVVLPLVGCIDAAESHAKGEPSQALGFPPRSMRCRRSTTVPAPYRSIHASCLACSNQSARPSKTMRSPNCTSYCEPPNPPGEGEKRGAAACGGVRSIDPPKKFLPRNQSCLEDSSVVTEALRLEAMSTIACCGRLPSRMANRRDLRPVYPRPARDPTARGDGTEDRSVTPRTRQIF